ncbi:hypothetical protein [Chondromyces apiculatus]|uniref:Uncharacterized protein n=1 Tax=Chondromyces apiculatus DSM 436 TaxID=1192034 RepID=A0A017T5V0_9BACT|nr:hypothetical protein [Chondromyces apiculatus]EYF04569.1 Hypothetical protein CAP_4389 [Chondromyces apiculatus DSM 436]
MAIKSKSTKAPVAEKSGEQEPKISVRKLTIKTNVKAQQSRGYAVASTSS